MKHTFTKKKLFLTAASTRNIKNLYAYKSGFLKQQVVIDSFSLDMLLTNLGKGHDNRQ